jgi:hypothetical protein
VRDAKKHDYHGDYGRVGNRAGHCASAVCILGNAWKAGWCRSGRCYQQAGPGSYGAPAFILVAGRGSCARKRRGVPADVAGAPCIRTQGLQPLYCPWPCCFPDLPIFPSAAFALRPLCVARDLERCDHVYPRWGEHNTTYTCVARLFVLGAAASIMGRSFLGTFLRPFALPTPIGPAATKTTKAGLSFGVPAHY